MALHGSDARLRFTEKRPLDLVTISVSTVGGDHRSAVKAVKEAKVAYGTLLRFLRKFYEYLQVALDAFGYEDQEARDAFNEAIKPVGAKFAEDIASGRKQLAITILDLHFQGDNVADLLKAMEAIDVEKARAFVATAVAANATLAEAETAVAAEEAAYKAAKAEEVPGWKIKKLEKAVIDAEEGAKDDGYEKAKKLYEDSLMTTWRIFFLQ